LDVRKTANLKLVVNTPKAEFSEVRVKRAAPKRVKFLTERQVEAIVKAADTERDKAMIEAAFIHGLRVSELVSLRWDQIDLADATMRIYRTKHGRDTTHPIPAGELRTLKRLKRQAGGEFVFVSRLGGPMTTRAFAQMLAKAAARAELPGGGNPHALRHACGYKLASEGRDLRVIQHYLGHRDVKSTEIYTEAAPADFRGLFR
jgi:type 1 fimbriae regulatory protein FimE